MQTLRNAHLVARFVLVWFALSMGVAIASPLVKPQSLQLVCSAAGAIKVLTDAGDEASGPLANTLDCPLCAAVGAPPPQVLVEVPAPMGLSYTSQIGIDAQWACRCAAAFPPRGPPAAL